MRCASGGLRVVSDIVNVIGTFASLAAMLRVVADKGDNDLGKVNPTAVQEHYSVTGLPSVLR